jgi:hypothetical protein
MNGLDGRLPPSPTPQHTPHFDARNQTVESFLQGAALTANRAAAPATTAGMPGNTTAPSSWSPQNVLRKKASKQLLQPAFEQERQEQKQPPRPFRPTLTGKRSTPDLRRFITSTPTDSPLAPSEEEFPLPSPSSPSPQQASNPYPTLRNFSFPPRMDSTLQASRPKPKSTHSSSSVHTLNSSSPSSQIRPSPGHEYVSSIVASPASASHNASVSDTASMRTNSTVRPNRAGSTSRMASPLSFVSVASGESGRSTPTAPIILPSISTRPAKGSSSKTSNGSAPSLRHFRSLQDIRNVISPHPPLPMLETSFSPSYSREQQPPSTPSSAHSTPPRTPVSSSSSQSNSLMSPSYASSQGMARARSDSKLLLGINYTLPSLAEDEVVSSAPTTPSRSSSINRGNRSGAPGMARSFSADAATTLSSVAASPHSRKPSINSLRRVQQTTHSGMPNQNHQPNSSISSLSSIDSGSSVSLSRSQASSSGLGFDFSSSSRESFDFSDHTTNSTLSSPDSSMLMNSPITPISAASDKHDPFEKLFQMQQNELLHNGLYGSYNGNVAPPLPFFPTPAAYDQMAALSRRNSANRRRASSLHHPVLETILGSPVLGSELDLHPVVTLKVMTDSTNFMLKVAKSASLREIKEKVEIKSKSSGIGLASTFGLAVLSAAPAGSESTAKASRVLEAKSSSAALNAMQQIALEDEEDWRLAITLATTKITLRVLA